MRFLLVLALSLQFAAPARADQGGHPGGGLLPTGDDLARSTPIPVVTAPNKADIMPLEAKVGGTGRSVQTFPLPLYVRVSSGFGMRQDPIDGSLRAHSGVDLPCAAGTPVNAVAAGRVIYSGWAGGFGNLVEIDHGGGLVTRYGHLSHTLVSRGQMIGPRAALGLVGSTGRSTGNHLHFEVRIDGRAVNPQIYLLRRGFTPSLETSPSAWLPSSYTVTLRWVGWSDPAKTGQLPFPVIR